MPFSKTMKGNEFISTSYRLVLLIFSPKVPSMQDTSYMHFHRIPWATSSVSNIDWIESITSTKSTWCTNAARSTHVNSTEQPPLVTVSAELPHGSSDLKSWFYYRLAVWPQPWFNTSNPLSPLLCPHRIWEPWLFMQSHQQNPYVAYNFQKAP